MTAEPAVGSWGRVATLVVGVACGAGCVRSAAAARDSSAASAPIVRDSRAPVPGPSASAAPAAAPAVSAALEPFIEPALAWLPGDVRVYFAMRPPNISLLQMLDTIPSVRGVACWADARRAVVSWHMISFELGAPAINLARVALERDEIERCALEVADALGLGPLTLRRDGDVTEFRARTGDRTHLRWGADGFVAWHDDRASLERLFDAQGPRIGGNRALGALLARVDRNAVAWGALDVDLSNALLGVASRGALLQARGASMQSGLDFVVLYANAADAARARVQLARWASAPRWSPAARQTLGGLVGVAQGDELRVELTALFRAPAPVMREFTEALQRAVSAAPAPGQAVAR